MSIFSRFLPRRKPPEFKNNISKEKENIRKTFGVYCHKRHEHKGDKLCTKCTALLATVLTKIDRCPYGITKPICERCDTPCFGARQTVEFREIMNSSVGGMFFRHPIMTIRHKLQSLGVTYAKQQQQKKIDDRLKAREELAKKRAKEKK